MKGDKLKIAIVVSRFNEDITENLLLGARETLKKNKVKEANINVVYVPGAFEIPLACERLARAGEYNGIVALGCVIRGETDHDFHIAAAVVRGIMDVILSYSMPVGFGVLTTQNLKQAQARSRGRHNKGKEAAQAVLEII